MVILPAVARDCRHTIQGSHLVAIPQYGNVLIVDPEEEFYAAEVTKIAVDVSRHGLGLIVFAEWYNVDIMAKMRFFDDNTRSWWTPITGEIYFSSSTSPKHADMYPTSAPHSSGGSIYQARLREARRQSRLMSCRVAMPATGVCEIQQILELPGAYPMLRLADPTPHIKCD